MLHGRAAERATIDRLLDHARAGDGGGVVLRGEPGIGKSALVGYAAEQAAGMRVLRTAGTESESDLGYATLHRLVLPVLDTVERLPEPQSAALRVALGQASGPPPERFLVALATLSLLSDVADECPLLCVVDDAHWADLSSLDVLAFVARRLDTEPIAMVFAGRTGEGASLELAGLVDLPLTGLDRPAAAALLAEHRRDVPVADLDRVLPATAGNPLVLLELPASALRGAAGEPLPLTESLRHAFLARARRHPPRVWQPLLLVAADGSGRPGTVRRAAAALGCDPDPLVSGELADLIDGDGPSLWFRHPLIRSAIYHGASPAERRDVHRALADALAGEPAERDRRAWHLGQAAVGPDEPVARELERSAERAMAGARPAAAAVALARAAELSTTIHGRTRREVGAAAAWWHSGDAATAKVLLASAEQVDDLTPEVRVEIAELRALIELRAGTPPDAVRLLLSTMPQAVRTSRSQALRMLLLLGESSFHADSAHALAETARWVERLPIAGDDADSVLARLTRAAFRAHAGIDPGLAPGDLATVETWTDPRLLNHAAGTLIALGHHELARGLRRTAVSTARARGMAGYLPASLESVVDDELARGRFAAAEALAEEGCQLAMETSQPNTACRHRGVLAVLAALRGHADDARTLADDVLAESRERRLAAATANAYRALGLLDLAAGRALDAMHHFEAIHGDRHAHPGMMFHSIGDLTEAAVRAGHPGHATTPVDRFTTWADTTDSPELGALAARCRALLAAGDPAETQFRLAIDLYGRIDRPLEQARTQLLLGEHLRRAHRRAEAGTHLRTALTIFHRLATPAWAERARHELRANGDTIPRHQPGPLATLTPRQLHIANAVAEGATNREIAAQLFLSPRTVDYHLRKVFQKTGITTRAALIHLVLTSRHL